MAEEKANTGVDVEMFLDLVGVQKKCQSNGNYVFACKKTSHATYFMLQRANE